MNDLYIPLRLTPGVKGVYLRTLQGIDELALADPGTKDLIHLLESLIKTDTSETQVRASQIVTADRDRLVSALFTSLYGPRVESTVSCRNCNQKFDLDFSLDELLEHYRLTTESDTDNGTYELEPGICFRLPTGEDEILINGLTGAKAERQLLERCLIEGDPESDNEKVQQKMAELAPVLNMEMEAVCPECSHKQQVQFDMQSFFLTKLIQERPLLLREIHCIASQYHWSQQEILNLPRNLRKHYAALIQPEN